jgi:CO/xanthine dehydrogenase Mo-binding subunit
VAQIAAETLGLRYEDVNVILADTAAAPAARGNVGTMGTSSAARAVHLAAEDARNKLIQLAAARLKASPEQLETRDRQIWIKGSDTRIPIADICLTNWQITGSANNPPGSSIRDEKTGRVIRSYAVACTITEVEVDVETGKIEILKITSGHDCGRAINPIMVENQIDLGLVMANGWVHTEEYVIDPKTGVVLNPNLLDYKLTTFLDMPQSKDVIKIVAERPCAWGPYGAKGFSETAVTAEGPAIVNAIYNATGVRINSGFLSPANVLKALKQTG